MDRIPTAGAHAGRAGRPLVRSLGIVEATIRCPRRGRIGPSLCDGCPFLCDQRAASGPVHCSYPIPADETFESRRETRESVRIALQHELERT